MIPRLNRISRREFPSPQERGIRLFSPLFSITQYPNKGLGVSRASIVVSRKVSPKAVVRNSLKRRFYEAIHGFLKTTPPSSFVVYPKKESIGLTTHEIKKEMEKVFGVNPRQ